MQKYECKTCGAELYWDSQAGCLKCEYCNSTFNVDEFEEKTKKEEQKAEQAEENATATDDSESSDLVVYKCNECGAEIVTAKSTVATTCVYCGKAVSITNKMVGNFKPDFVIPFAVPEEKAKEIYRKYCNSTFLTPKHFKDENELKKMKGIYAPFWLHSFTNTASANIYGENTTSRKRGDDKVITHHMYNVMMSAKGDFDKIPTDALKNLDNSLMDAIEPFDYNHMEKFNPAYMAGYYAEEYNESSSETKERAKKRSQDVMQSQMLSQAGAYQTKRITVYNDKLSNYDASYVMLPMWLFYTEYKGKKYTFAINGDTGKISGSLPVSIPKVLATIGSSMLVTQIIALIIRLIG